MNCYYWFIVLLLTIIHLSALQAVPVHKEEEEEAHGEGSELKKVSMNFELA
jgi:hypothetical protein